jgi:hypothetical protein
MIIYLAYDVGSANLLQALPATANVDFWFKRGYSTKTIQYIAGSSNGRTHPSGGCYWGSSP